MTQPGPADGSMTVPRTGWVGAGSPRTFIHRNTVDSDVKSPSPLAQTTVSHARLLAVQRTALLLSPHAPRSQQSTMDAATPRAIDTELRELEFG